MSADMPLRTLDLFSGIGGFSLGLERTGGFKTVAFCEIEKFPCKVLAKHWPDVPIYTDVRELTNERLRQDGLSVDVITAGFPCQDISIAGKGAGIEGERSGLWSEVARLAGEIRPDYVILENVAAILGRGIDTVLGDLAAIGYDAEWHCIPASAVGAPHRRDRWWAIGYPHRDAGEELPPLAVHLEAILTHIKSSALRHVADTVCLRQPGQGEPIDPRHTPQNSEGQADHAEPDSIEKQWSTEPDVGRVANGVPNRVERLTGLGNAVVPQIPEIIGRAILESMNES